MKKNKFWLKLAGSAFLLHVILIALSILEVAVYSYLIVPGKHEGFYQAHAEQSGPWVSGIAGSLIIFLMVRHHIRKNYPHTLTYVIALPLTYILLDILMLLPFNINWTEHLPIFLMANGAKILASLSSWILFRSRHVQRY